MTDWHKIVLMVSVALAGMLFLTVVNHNLRHPNGPQTQMDRSSGQ